MGLNSNRAQPSQGNMQVELASLNAHTKMVYMYTCVYIFVHRYIRYKNKCVCSVKNNMKKIMHVQQTIHVVGFNVRISPCTFHLHNKRIYQFEGNLLYAQLCTIQTVPQLSLFLLPLVQ